MTREKLLAEIESDARLAAPQDRCTVLGALAQGLRSITKEEYARRCPDYPLEERS